MYYENRGEMYWKIFENSKKLQKFAHEPPRKKMKTLQNVPAYAPFVKKGFVVFTLQASESAVNESAL